MQGENETSHDFIVAVHCLAEHCAFGELRDELIRDRIVVGIRDAKLSQKFQLNAELTLEKAETEVRQSESVKEQQGTIRISQDTEPSKVTIEVDSCKDIYEVNTRNHPSNSILQPNLHNRVQDVVSSPLIASLNVQPEIWLP